MAPAVAAVRAYATAGSRKSIDACAASVTAAMPPPSAGSTQRVNAASACLRGFAASATCAARSLQQHHQDSPAAAAVGVQWQRHAAAAAAVPALNQMVALLGPKLSDESVSAQERLRQLEGLLAALGLQLADSPCTKQVGVITILPGRS